MEVVALVSAAIFFLAIGTITIVFRRRTYTFILWSGTKMLSWLGAVKLWGWPPDEKRVELVAWFIGILWIGLGTYLACGLIWGLVNR